MMTTLQESENDMREGKYLFRGINRRELKELIQNGPDNFIVHQGTNWSRFPLQDIAVRDHANINLTRVFIVIPYSSKYFTNYSSPQRGSKWEWSLKSYRTNVTVYYISAYPYSYWQDIFR